MDINPGRPIRSWSDIRIERQQAARNKKARGGDDVKAAVRDEVILSPMAQDLQKIKKEMQDASEVREDKVSEVAGRISRGEYRVDTGKIAAKIVRTGSLDELV